MQHKLLHLDPHKIAVACQCFGMFCETRLNFVNLNVVHCGEIDPTLVLCSGKLGCNFMDMYEYIPTIRVSHVNL